MTYGKSSTSVSSSSPSSDSSSFSPSYISRSDSNSTMTSVYQEEEPLLTAPPSPIESEKCCSTTLKRTLDLQFDDDAEEAVCSDDASTLESPPNVLRRQIPVSLLPTTTTTNKHQPRTIRAAPFERLVHHRNLPKDGTIDPLKINEYFVAQQQFAASTNTKQQQQQRDQQQKQQSPKNGGSSPPVSEISIRIMPKSETTGRSDFVELSSEDWKGLYLTSRRELHVTQARLHTIAEENRFWKRQLIELQKRLYEARRNSAASVAAAAHKRSYSCACSICTSHAEQAAAAASASQYQPWTVPPSTTPKVPSRPRKLQRVSYDLIVSAAPPAPISSSSPVTAKTSSEQLVPHSISQDDNSNSRAVVAPEKNAVPVTTAKSS